MDVKILEEQERTFESQDSPLQKNKLDTELKLI